MPILIFIVVLVVLIVVHELGHFFVAKWSGMRVDEFGIGYPPRAWGKRIGETEYTLNWLPFGGFVKIFGEDSEQRAVDSAQGTETQTHTGRAFTDKPKILQALVLVAGIAMNLLFAWVLISATLVLGAPRALSPEEALATSDARIVVAGILPGSPAQTAGLIPGDAIISAHRGATQFSGTDSEAFTTFISDTSSGNQVSLSIEREGKEQTLEVAPIAGLIKEEPERFALGVRVATVGTLPVPWYEAPVEGAVLTWGLIQQVAVGLVSFFGSIITFSADLSQVSGPVGIAGAVGNASDSGIAALLLITAIISVNLALINLLPVPALDGGRLLFVFIEAITRKNIPHQVAGTVNAIGFLLLILLMVVVTASDIFKLVS